MLVIHLCREKYRDLG